MTSGSQSLAAPTMEVRPPRRLPPSPQALQLPRAEEAGDDDLELDTDNPDIDVESTDAVGTYLYTAPEVEAVG